MARRTTISDVLGVGSDHTRHPRTAGSMKLRQIRAGTEPPTTSANPATQAIGISPLAWPIQAQVASCGTNPQNHASLKLSAVPVFPATGRPKYAAVPVPARTAPLRA